MDSRDIRQTVLSLADDLGWLETHSRSNPAQAAQAVPLRLAAALARNVVGPAIDASNPKPLHLAVVGGAGAGKSTVVNFLVGKIIAEANPQAGYTRHPTAFVPEPLLATWPKSEGFLGTMTKLDRSAPANRDEDVYQLQSISVSADDPFADFAIWDCPDMTTAASAGYANRLMEIAAMADVIVYVASDERYNDEVPTQILHLLIRAGKAVIVCLTKMRETDMAGLSQHFQADVLGKLLPLPDGSRAMVPVVCIPQLTVAERQNPETYSGRYRAALANPILAMIPNASMRSRTVSNAIRFLETASAGLLDIARADIAHVDAWKATVASGRAGFEDRYRREFLAGETFRRFDRTRDELLEWFELPGRAKPVSTVLGFLRWPYAKVRQFLVGLVVRPPALSLSERDVLTNALSAWLDGLQADAIRNAMLHPVWKQAATALGTGSKQTAIDRFTLALRDYEAKELLEMETEGQRLTERVRGNPAVVNGLRGLKLAFEIISVILLIWYGYSWGWWLILLIPLVLAIVHQFAEWGVAFLVETARAKVRGHRLSLVSQFLTSPLDTWLAEMPMTEGTSLERLHQILARVPDSIRRIAAHVKPGAVA